MVVRDAPDSAVERLAARLGRGLTPSHGTFAGCATGVAAGLVAAGRLPDESRWLVAWVAGALVYLVTAWLIVAGLDAAGTAGRSQRRDRLRVSAFWIVLIASCASAFAGAMMLHRPVRDTSFSEDWHFALAVVTIATAWFVLHTDFGFRYAGRYYSAVRRGPPPILFRAHSPPDYLDFMLLSFLIGITTGASDVEIRARDLRWLAMLHNVVAFVFNLLIVSICVNVITSSLH
jgi:uncharacterized membrane protein